MINEEEVSYHNFKQGKVSRSSAEAVYVALYDAAYNLGFIDKILSQPAVPSTYSLALKTYAYSAIRHIINNTKHTQTTHLAVKNLYIEENVALKHIPFKQQLADALTKAHRPIMYNRTMELLHM
jgi:hypothetical protein